MMRKIGATIDLAVGSLLAIAAAAFGVVGFFSGLNDNSHANQWYLSALILGVLSGAVLLDELRMSTLRPARRLDALLGTIFLIGALALGTVGFILGLGNKAHAVTWLLGGLVLAILSLTAMSDELRRVRQAGAGLMDGFTVAAIVFSLLTLFLGVVGFILGLASKSHADTWMYGALVSGVVSFGWDIEAGHREIVVGAEEMQPGTAHGDPGMARP
jgi:hypothetical protein